MKVMIGSTPRSQAPTMTEARDTAGHTKSQREALERAYDLYAASLLRYARALLGSTEDAEDAVQEVFVRLARDAGRLRRIEDLQRYLLRSTRNAAYEVLRGRQRRQRLHEDEAVRLSEAASDSENPEIEAVLAAFETLPPEQREVMALKIFQGLTFREIGQVIGKSQNTVSSRYRYAIEGIRRIIGS
ncbi:MAG: sigma-70 family RNA polymerase sigma factor [Armatimonadota bacterium]|nr:sigma-70 family RNA polymerase sigma factor [Armatimonadota bacterium]